jgi:GNAT superfamily N-acetyltransferase
MVIRTAILTDIPQIQVVRNSVKENTLSDPALVTDADCADMMLVRGKGWVSEIDEQIVGFAIVDLQEKNVWALFLHPEFENKGIGRQLHDGMLDWYFAQTSETLWLGTTPNTRAELFYQKSGWTAVGQHGKDETKFEMTAQDWQAWNAARKK